VVIRSLQDKTETISSDAFFALRAGLSEQSKNRWVVSEAMGLG
jgi:hypothetical protein